MTDTTKHRLNCFCSRHPLLAVYGVDARGRPYIHIKVYKQRRVFAEFVAYGGEVAVCCRECVRWHRIVIRNPTEKAELLEVQPPAEVSA